MEDLTVFVDDEEIATTAALLEPDLLYRGSKLAAAAWLSLVGTMAGAFAAVTLSSETRSSILAFAIYLVVAFLLLGGLRPATHRMLGRPIIWPAKLTFFWAVLLACVAVFSAGFASPWLAYGLSCGGGFFIGMMHGSLNPQYIKREDTWMAASLALGVLSTVLATLVQRTVLSEPDTIGAAAVVGAIAGGLFSAPVSVLLFRLWDEAHGFKRMAMLFLHNDNFASKAVTYLDNALVLAPSDPELYNLRAVAWSKLDDPERAAADWKRACELAPEDPEPHMNIGVDHLRRGEIDQAIEAFDAALARNPQSATVHCNLGTALERHGELDRAIAHYDKAIALRADYANAYSNRGYARYRMGDYDQAVTDCEQALELNPELPAAFVNRGHALRALGERAGAAQSYRAAIEIPLSPEVHEEALRGLEALAVATGSPNAR
jgi:Flp pilus assembly protein TadD